MKEALYITNWCKISNQSVTVNNKKEVFEENFPNFAAFIKNLYKKGQISYPKFYKMDNLSKLGFLGAEILLSESDVLKKYGTEEIGVIMANSSSSLDTDLDYQELIRDKSNYFPSPAVFVYTLPNILIGEICIRHKIKGENAFLISEEFNSNLIYNYVNELFTRNRVDSCFCGWVEVMGDKFNAFCVLVEKAGRATPPEATGFKPIVFNNENLNFLFTNN